MHIYFHAIISFFSIPAVLLFIIRTFAPLGIIYALQVGLIDF